MYVPGTTAYEVTEGMMGYGTQVFFHIVQKSHHRKYPTNIS